MNRQLGGRRFTRNVKPNLPCKIKIKIIIIINCAVKGTLFSLKNSPPFRKGLSVHFHKIILGDEKNIKKIKVRVKHIWFNLHKPQGNNLDLNLTDQTQYYSSVNAF